MGYNYKIILQYEGTRYNGWQKQGNTENTIQGRLETVLFKMTGKQIEIHGSGRTDAGVHAMGQVANFHLPEYRKPEQITAYLNQYLPEDIAVLQTEQAPERFHSRLSAVGKVYRYQIRTWQKKDVFQRRFQYGFGKPLNVDAMKKAAGFLCGTHDFKSFCGNPKMKKSTIRTIRSVHVEQAPENGTVTFTFEGNGFLQYMARIMSGTLIETGSGERLPEELPRILEAKNRQMAGFTAPPEGLCLMEVQYKRASKNWRQQSL